MIDDVLGCVDESAYRIASASVAVFRDCLLRIEIMRIFRFFENRIEPTAMPPGPPPDGLGAFYWHHARQARGLVVALFAAGLVVALLDTTIPVFVGQVVTMVSSHTPHSVLHDFGLSFLSWP